MLDANLRKSSRQLLIKASKTAQNWCMHENIFQPVVYFGEKLQFWPALSQQIVLVNVHPAY